MKFLRCRTCSHGRPQYRSLPHPRQLAPTLASRRFCVLRFVFCGRCNPVRPRSVGDVGGRGQDRSRLGIRTATPRNASWIKRRLIGLGSAALTKNRKRGRRGRAMQKRIANVLGKGRCGFWSWAEKKAARTRATKRSETLGQGCPGSETSESLPLHSEPERTLKRL